MNDIIGLLPSLKLTFSHLKMDGWKMILSFWDGPIFRGELLVSGSVFFLVNEIFQCGITLITLSLHPITLVTNSYQTLQEFLEDLLWEFWGRGGVQ